MDTVCKENEIQFFKPRWHMNKYSLQEYEVQLVKLHEKRRKA